LGFLASYVANLLRMVIIVLVGYYTDSAQSDLQNLLLAHSYAGWIIFLGWLALFWGLLFKFLPAERASSAAESTLSQKRAKQWGLRACDACGGALTPAIPAIRCPCGRYYHRKCVATEARCPSCNRTFVTTGSQATEGL
jgi:hypothetical protein